jgi:pyruvate/2-oxoglutarate dehydrogenase complex dihydrolipoamide dehydrogenase (E3) component
VIDGAVGVDMARVKARKDAIARKSEVGVERWLRSLDNCTVYQGHARFEAAHRVRVGDDLLEAERIFINVGARAFVPPFPGLDQVDYLTNSTILDLEVLPEHLIIVGGGYIGLEFAQMYRRFGSQVTLIETGDRLIKRESPDISAAVTEILEAEGVRVRLNAQCIGVGSQGDAVTASVDCTAGAPEVVGSHLLLAVGRRPNTDDLGLDAAGIEVDRRGLIPVDETLQTAVAGVWALGECNGRGAFTHTAYNDYEIVAANLLHGDPRRVTDRIDCYALYIDPPLGRVGMTEQQVRASGRPALIATRAMTRVGRAVEKGETQGFMKVLVDAGTSRILGAAILGVGGDEVIHSILDVMYAEAPYTVIQRAVHIHPTVAELIPTMLADLKPLGG